MGQDILDNDIYEKYSEEWDDQEYYPFHRRYTPKDSIRSGNNVRSEFGHTLLADGYEVLEVDYYCLTYNGKDINYKFDIESLPPEDATPYEKYVYTFLLTRKQGEEGWYIAEEVLTEKAGGPRNRG